MTALTKTRCLSRRAHRGATGEDTQLRRLPPFLRPLVEDHRARPLRRYEHVHRLLGRRPRRQREVSEHFGDSFSFKLYSTLFYFLWHHDLERVRYDRRRFVTFDEDLKRDGLYGFSKKRMIAEFVFRFPNRESHGIRGSGEFYIFFPGRESRVILCVVFQLRFVRAIRFYSAFCYQTCKIRYK